MMVSQFLCSVLLSGCRLSDVYHVQGNPQSSEALVRACADTAATAVVLLPWSQPAAAADVDDIVTAGMVDAGVLSVVRRLRALNPWAQVRCDYARILMQLITETCRMLQLLECVPGCDDGKCRACIAGPMHMLRSLAMCILKCFFTHRSTLSSTRTSPSGFWTRLAACWTGVPWTRRLQQQQAQPLCVVPCCCH
jgi:hypothetical protein